MVEEKIVQVCDKDTDIIKVEVCNDRIVEKEVVVIKENQVPYIDTQIKTV